MLAGWKLPPEERRQERPGINSAWAQNRTALDEARDAMSRRTTQLNDELRLLRVTDSLRQVMAESGLVTVDLAGSQDTLRVPAVQRNIARELSILPGEPKTKIGIFAIPLWQGSHPGIGVTGRTGTGEVFLFGGEEPACVVTRTVDINDRGAESQLNGLPGSWYSWNPEAPPSNVLGPCRYYATYGTPGSQVSAWMRNGGVAFASGLAASDSIERFARQRAFGVRYAGFLLPVDAEACLAGRKEACGGVLTSELSKSDNLFGPDPARLQHPERVYSYGRYGRGPQRFGGFEARLLADVEAEFGSDRFQSFWSSDEELNVAFASAFGLPLGDWTHTWLEARFTPDRLGPGLPWQTLLYSLAFMSFCVSIVFAAARRRQVG